MGVKVVLERTVKAGYENTVWEKLRDLRSQAVRARGYMYGETWRSMDNPRTFVVVSAWGTREHWETWSNDEFRRKMDESINRMLRKPCTIRVYEGNCSELRGSEQPAAFQEGIETSSPPGAKEGCQGHLAVGALP